MYITYSYHCSHDFFVLFLKRPLLILDHYNRMMCRYIDGHNGRTNKHGLFIYGHILKQSMQSKREVAVFLVSPQHSVFFPILYLRAHLSFFSSCGKQCHIASTGMGRKLPSVCGCLCVCVWQSNLIAVIQTAYKESVIPVPTLRMGCLRENSQQ